MTFHRNSYNRPKTIAADPKLFDPILVSLLTLCTPYEHESHIVNIIKKLPFIKDHKIEELGGNLLITVGENPKTLFSSHMDIVGSVSKKNTDNGDVDAIILMSSEEDKDIIYGAKKIVDTNSKSVKLIASTLGADDKVGVFIMLKLIEREVKGLYVFHVGEERGGIGSKFLTTTHKDKFVGIERAIAYDRAGYGDVIDYQRGGVCCSKEFGEALAEQLNITMPPQQRFKSGVTGTFTDTANYRDIIPECTNISAGYFSQHGESEHMDYYWLTEFLLPAALRVEYDNLPTKRKPQPAVTYYGNTTWNGNTWKDKDRDKNRKTWATADENTLMFECPVWTPETGWPEDANPAAVKKAIRYCYMNSLQTYKEKESAADAFYNELLLNQMYLEEICALETQIKLMENKEEYGTVEDIELFRKREFLTTLIEMSKKLSMSNTTIRVAVSGYVKGGEKYLKQHEAKKLLEQFTDKELRKLNSILYHLAYWISVGATNLDEKNINALNEIAEYIKKHHAEEGFLEIFKLHKDKDN